MAARSLNKAQLIGNLTRDPELRYTPQGTAVCTFGLATNRSWTTEAGEKREDTEFHRIVSWNKLAELCSQLLFKGRRVFVEGRLQTRQWTAQDGSPRSTTEIVISDMIILDSKRAPGQVEPEGGPTIEPVEPTPPPAEETVSAQAVKKEPQEKKPAPQAAKKSTKKEAKKEPEEEIADDIPF